MKLLFTNFVCDITYPPSYVDCLIAPSIISQTLAGFTPLPGFYVKMTRARKERGQLWSKKNKFTNVVTIIRLSIRNTGLWLGASGLVHWLAKVSIACFFMTYVLQVIALVKARDDPERLFECLSVLLFCGMGILKLISLHANSAHWLSLLSQVATLENSQLADIHHDPLEYESDNDDGNDIFSAHIHSYTDNFKSTSKILFRIYTFTGVIYVISPFAEYIIRKFIIGSDVPEYPHILPGWAPLDSLSIIGYLLTILVEAVAATYCVCLHIAFDLTVVGLMMFLCGQFSILTYCSERIAGKGNTLNVTKERDTRAHYRIIKCHRTHILLVELITKLDKLIKNILGIYFAVVTLTLCSVAVRLESEDMSTMQLVSLLQYMCATLTQLFLFCSYGEAVLNKNSINMGEGPFGAATWCISPRIRRELAILSAGMMQPRRLHAGPFSSLDLPSFIQIVRAAYSYYAVLGKKSS